MTDQPEPEDTCQPIEVDDEIIRVRGFGELRERDRAFAAEIVRAAKRKFETGPAAERLRQEIAGVLRDAPGRWNIRARADAVMGVLDRFLDIGDAEAWCKTCRRVWDGPRHQCETHPSAADPHAEDALEELRRLLRGANYHRERAETRLGRVAALHEQWVKAGAPPLGVPLARWWDKRLAEQHKAIHAPTNTTTGEATMTDTRIALNLMFASDDKPAIVATRVGEVVAAEVAAPLVGMHWSAFTLGEPDGDEPDWEALAKEREAERDGAYRERAHLVALLAALTDGAVITYATDVDEPGWQIVYLNLGDRQASWHISPRDADLFTHVERVEHDDPRGHWDGHTTQDKYAGIAAWTAELMQQCGPECAEMHTGAGRCETAQGPA
jgi:hypothetical protein